MAVRDLGGSDRGVVRDQAHFHRDLARGRVGVWAHQEETAAVGQPFVIDALEHTYRVVQMLQHVGQNDVVVATRESGGFERGMNELGPVAKFAPRLFNCFARGFHAGDVVETLPKPSGKVSLETPQFQEATVPEEGFKRADHVGVHHVEIEPVGVLVIGRVFDFDVVVARCLHMAHLPNVMAIVRVEPLLLSVLNPSFW